MIFTKSILPNDVSILPNDVSILPNIWLKFQNKFSARYKYPELGVEKITFSDTENVVLEDYLAEYVTSSTTAVTLQINNQSNTAHSFASASTLTASSYTDSSNASLSFSINSDVIDITDWLNTEKATGSNTFEFLKSQVPLKLSGNNIAPQELKKHIQGNYWLTSRKLRLLITKKH